MANLQAVDLKTCTHKYGTTQLLDFFKSAPLLHTILLEYSMPDSSDAAPGRIVRLRHLKVLSISTRSSRSILHHHLHIPAGASFTSEFYLDGGKPPLLDYLPESCPNFSNLSHITAINILFDSTRKFTRLSGPSGSLRVLAHCTSGWHAQGNQILRSLSPQILSTTQRLTILKYPHTKFDDYLISRGLSTTRGPAILEYPNPRFDEHPIPQTLSFANDLRTLVLVDCDNLPFTRALDPEQDPSNLIRCPNMEELIMYLEYRSPFEIEHIIKMARNRASRGAKLSSITIVTWGVRFPREDVFKLREHVKHVEYRVVDTLPDWDDVAGESGSSRGE